MTSQIARLSNWTSGRRKQIPVGRGIVEPSLGESSFMRGAKRNPLFWKVFSVRVLDELMLLPGVDCKQVHAASSGEVRIRHVLTDVGENLKDRIGVISPVLTVYTFGWATLMTAHLHGLTRLKLRVCGCHGCLAWLGSQFTAKIYHHIIHCGRGWKIANSDSEQNSNQMPRSCDRF